MGHGSIRQTGNKLELIHMGVLKIEKVGDHADKLKRILDHTLSLIESQFPDELAIEGPFFGKNVQSMLKLGRAQGVAIAAALHREIPVVEYSPRKIKQSLTGNGNASKEQVSAMVGKLLNKNTSDLELDATDGAAAAICHAFQKGGDKKGKRYSNWAAYLKDNPHKRTD